MRVKKLYIAVAMAFCSMSCADLPKTNDPRFLGEPYTAEEFEDLDDSTRKEMEYKADSISEKYNAKFAEDCTPYSESQKRNKRLNCVTFK